MSSGRAVAPLFTHPRTRPIGALAVILACAVVLASDMGTNGTVILPEASQVAARHTERFLNDTAERYHGQRIATVAFSEDMRTIATNYVDGFLAIWRSGDLRKPVFARPAPGPDYRYDQVVLSPDGKYVAEDTGDPVGGRVDVWPVADPQGGRTYSVSWPDLLWEFMFTHDDQLLLNVASVDPTGSSSYIYLADTNGAIHASGKLPSELVRFFGDQYGMATFNRGSGEYLAAANWGQGEGGYLTWSPGKPARLFGHECNTEGTFSPDGALFACHAGADDDVEIWDTATDRQVGRWPATGETATRAGQLTFVDSGRELAVERGSHDSHFRLDTTVEVDTLAAHKPVATFALTPIEQRPNLASRVFAANNILVYALDFAQGDSGETDLRFFAFPIPVIP